VHPARVAFACISPPRLQSVPVELTWITGVVYGCCIYTVAFRSQLGYSNFLGSGRLLGRQIGSLGVAAAVPVVGVSWVELLRGVSKVLGQSSPHSLSLQPLTGLFDALALWPLSLLLHFLDESASKGIQVRL